MDDPAVDRDQLDRSLQFIRAINRRLGGTGAALGHLRRWSAGWPAGEVIRIIDLGTGSADIPLAIVRWARTGGLRVQITAIDAHPTTLDLARQHVKEALGASQTEIEFLRADALSLMDHFDPGAFDYAHAGMFLHHLDDIEVMTALRVMDRITTRGVIWNDLVRGPVEAVAVRLLTLAGPAMVKHDALVSVAAGFTRREVLDLASRVGLPHIGYQRHLFGRFTLVSTKS